MRRNIFLMLVLSVLGYVVGSLGSMSFPVANEVSLFWPGMLIQVLGGIWFGGWGVAAGVLFPVAIGLTFGDPSAMIAGLVPANLIQGLVPAIVFRRRREGPLSPDSARWGYFLVAGGILPALLGAISATAAFHGMGAAHGAERLVALGLAKFAGELVPVAVFGPLLLWALTPLLRDYGLLCGGWWSRGYEPAESAAIEPDLASHSLREQLVRMPIPTRILGGMLAAAIPFLVFGLLEMGKPAALPPRGPNLEAFLISLSLCIFFVIGSLVARSIYVPIRRLRNGVARFACGSLDQRVNPEGPYEIARLGEDFNRMASDLERAWVTLEERVRERTQDLETATGNLEQIQKIVVDSERLAAVGRFAALLSHEVRNPLAILMSSLALMDTETVETGLKQESLSSMRDEIRRITRIVDALAEAARPQEEPEVPVDLNAVVEEITSLLKGKLIERHIVLGKQLSPGLRPVCAPRDKVKLVFFNLVMNAFDAMPDGGILLVSSCGDEGANYMDIADSGPGLPRGLVPFPFEPFTTSKGEKGRGLGLYVCQQILGAVGGSIELRTQTGKGAVFRVTLPVAQANMEFSRGEISLAS